MINYVCASSLGQLVQGFRRRFLVRVAVVVATTEIAGELFVVELVPVIELAVLVGGRCSPSGVARRLAATSLHQMLGAVVVVSDRGEAVGGLVGTVSHGLRDATEWVGADTAFTGTRADSTC